MKTAIVEDMKDGWSNGPAPKNTGALKSMPKPKRRSSVKLGKGLLD